MHFMGSVLVVWISISLASAVYTCPSACDCMGGVNKNVEIICPKGFDTNLTVTVKADEYVYLKCALNQDTSVFKWLDGLQVGPVRSVIFELCPTPQSISKLLENINTTSVKILTVRYSNLKNTLQKSQFDGFNNISDLRISNSGLTGVPADFFQGLENLTFLDLRENDIAEMPRDVFASIPNITRLELGGNHMKYLVPGIFQNLSNLSFLNLWRNSLVNLTRSVFRDVKTLKSLDLSLNGIMALPEDIFFDLNVLKNLSLSSNNFSTLPEGLFSGTMDLGILLLNNNRRRLVLPGGLLSNLTQLKQVTLSSNNISYLPENLLWNSPAIETIRLERNALSELPADLFKDASNLITLDISKNKLASLPDTVFSGLGKLRVLKLAENQLTNIQEATFQSLRSLEVLYIDRNRLGIIDNRAFFNNRQLKQVDLSHNLLTFTAGSGDSTMFHNGFGSQSPLSWCEKLEVIKLANNSLGEIFGDWRTMLRLSKLDLRFNKIKVIELEDLKFFSDTVVIDLSNNQITLVDLRKHELLIHFENNSDHTTQFNRKVILRNNPLSCDCKAYSLLQYMEGNLSPKVNQFMELVTEGLTCSTPVDLVGVLVRNLKSRLVTCKLDSQDMRGEKCPELCSCFGRPHDGALIIDCANVGLLDAPRSLPLLPGLNHTEVILHGNMLQSLPNASLPGYQLVTKLYASRNNISWLDESKIMMSLEVLELDHNKIRFIESRTLEKLQNLPGLMRMSLYGNPWQCDCDAISMLIFVQTNYRKMDLLMGNMTCTNGEILSQLSADDLCPMPVNLVIAVSFAIAASGIIIGALAALYYRYQQEIKVWLFARGWCLWFVTELELDKNKLYDAFISYSHKDKEFVETILVPGLESGQNPYKLCVHFRNWIPGDFISNQIGKSVDNSCRTVVILSPQFLESEWGRLEFRAAHKQALNERRSRVIVVIYEDVGPIDQLDSELKAYLSTNTYLKWGDTWFWEKLRYALPHRVKATPKLRVKTVFDDKLELMEPTTPCATTPPADSMVETVCIIPKNQHIIPLSMLNGSEKVAIGNVNSYFALQK